MGYRFRRKDKTIEHGIRRIAREQIDAAVAEIDTPQGDIGETVHQVRKHAKKLRGLIRLVRPVFPAYAVENAAIRDAARMLSGLRDSKAMVETFDKLAATHPAAEARFAPVRALLDAGQASTNDSALGESLAAFRAELVACRVRAARWQIRKSGFAALQGGLEKTYSRGRAAMQAFARNPNDATCHEWRKRTKYHWYHARLLSPIAPRRLIRQAHAARDLGELLGEHHDLSVLRVHLRAIPDMPGDDALRGPFESLIVARQAELAQAALALGGRLYAETPRRLSGRWKIWWKAWKPRAS